MTEPKIMHATDDVSTTCTALPPKGVKDDVVFTALSDTVFPLWAQTLSPAATSLWGGSFHIMLQLQHAWHCPVAGTTMGQLGKQRCHGGALTGSQPGIYRGSRAGRHVADLAAHLATPPLPIAVTYTQHRKCCRRGSQHAHASYESQVAPCLDSKKAGHVWVQIHACIIPQGKWTRANQQLHTTFIVNHIYWQCSHEVDGTTVWSWSTWNTSMASMVFEERAFHHHQKEFGGRISFL